MRKMVVLAIVVAGAAADPTRGQSNLDATDKFGWGENVGWLNWRDADGAERGVRIHDRLLSGFIWAENAGWINVGDGTPADGVRYGNTDGEDSGVNIDTNGDLFGLAWGENIGWVNFDTRDKGGQRARFDIVAGRFRGFVWGENAGWINLDDSDAFVAMADCSTGDADGDGDIDLADLLALQECFSGPAGGPLGPVCARCYDFDGDGDADLADFIVFQTRFTGSH